MKDEGSMKNQGEGREGTVTFNESRQKPTPELKADPERKYVIRHSNGTYFAGYVPNFGPKFGATKAEAQKFDSATEAWQLIDGDWRFGRATVRGAYTQDANTSASDGTT